MKKIRTVLVGLGRIGWAYHLPQISSSKNFELTAVVDPMQERLDEVTGKFPACHGYKDYDEMLSAEKPDLVVVASPTIFHKDQIIAAFRAGADVFAEKPLTAEVAETQAIVAEMEKTGRKLMVYQPRRLDKDCLQAQEIINSGVLGKIHQLRRNVRNYSRRNDWQALSRFAGGMLNNYGVHYMDQACFAAGSFAVKCEYCELRRINALGDAEDFVKVILRNQDNDMAVEVEISQSCSFPCNQWHIEGEYGTAFYSSDTREWQIRYADPADFAEKTLLSDLAANGRQYPRDQVQWSENFHFSGEEPQEFYDNLYRFLTAGGEPIVKISETVKIIEMLDAARKADHSRK